ncbi:pyruvate kinase [Mycobacterium seoulense]|uniref:pyruvate kinase n=1 Tax=Mycobacterium seoulense TaxID=386911 RepID=A0A7I7P7B5_9MYCO|nr:pyruvate kinase [Mycobacterium seoulense]BBY03558.1 pyruvate kinase [Mycobacterium seoulense]
MSGERLANQVGGAPRLAQAGVDAGVPGRLVDLLDQIDDLLTSLSDAEASWAGWLSAVATEHRSSARNLVHYWAIRQSDLRELQATLAEFGLSSLGRSEAHVQATLAAVRSAIAAMVHGSWRPPPPSAVPIAQGSRILRQRAAELLGPQPAHRTTRIMVTLPSAAASDAEVVREFVQRGMNIARINCAHDDVRAWRAMVHHVRDAAARAGTTCLVAMDLAGPKLRTGPLMPGPRVLKLRPRRDALGHVVAPARAWLTSTEEPSDPPEPEMALVTVPRQWLANRAAGDVLALTDARGSKRRLVLGSLSEIPEPSGFVVSGRQTTYLQTGTVLLAEGDEEPTEVGLLPTTEQSLLLHAGDLLRLTRDCSPAPVEGSQAIPRIGCTLPEAFDQARVGDAVHFDDGRIGGRVVSVDRDVLTVRIDHPENGRARLKAGKGINMPDTDLPVPALTDRDVVDLAAVVELADLVDMSFVRTPSDVERLLDELDRLGGDNVGIVLKIETRQGFEHLPQLLLTAMRRPLAGVMIARGDLAVECGYERMAELQEEILWLCEAAHLPVIWATQVLEQLAKTGLPSRAEISDAAMSERAECVMLNKGPYLNDAITALDNIMSRMAEHHYKKNALFRPLRSWSASIGESLDDEPRGPLGPPS